jgi:hypothetical protein
MDTTKAQDLARRAASAATRTLLHREGGHTTEQQTLTIARSVEEVLRACRDADVLDTLVKPAGNVRENPAGTYAWTLADTTVETQVHVEPNRVVFSTGSPTAPGDPVVAVEAWPAPRDLGAAVVLRLTVPAGTGELGGGLAFTMLYRLRALLQTGEAPTLGDVPSGRDGKR